MTTSMRILVAVLLLTVPVLGQLFSDLDGQWEGWKTKFHKTYQDQDEMAYRRMVWETNLKLIEKHNQEASAGLHSFTLGLNHLADMTTDEINMRLNGDLVDFQNVTFEKEDSGSPRPLPRTRDWRKRGWVTPVRDQGNCQSCWAFAAVGALEGQMKRVSGRLTPLSPQNLMDCSTKNHGCKPGWVYEAFDDVRRNRGIDSEASYPYKAETGRRCYYRNSGKAGYCKGYKFLRSGSEDALKYAVARVGPIAVSILAEKETFNFYTHGVFNKSCSSQNTNHAVLVVGYGTAKDGQEYWRVKNSWGTAWGEGGYIRMARNQGNLCSIASSAVYPTV